MVWGTPISISSISSDDNLENLTKGELLIALRLKSLKEVELSIKGKEIETIWAQVNLLQGLKRVDFLLFLQNALIVIEVKDHKSLENIEYPWNDGNAWDQIQGYISLVTESVEGYLPVYGFVIFPYLQETANVKPYDNYTQNKMNLTTFWGKGYSSMLKNKITEIMSSNLFNSTDRLFCSMQKLIPDYFITTGDCGTNLDLNTLDKRQAQIVFSNKFTGDRIIYGIAGSGKTIMMKKKVKWYSDLYPDSNILVLCYNKALSKYLSKEINESKIEVRTIYSWMNKIYKQWMDQGLEVKTFVKERYLDELTGEILRGINKGYKLPSFDAIFIDEGQDFQKSWFEIVRTSYSYSDNSMFLVCLDGLQSIHRRQLDKFSWSDIGIQARGRVIKLTENYRNRKEISNHGFNYIKTITDESEGEEDFIQLITNYKPIRDGGKVICKQLTVTNLSSYIKDEIDKQNTASSIMILIDFRAPKKISAELVKVVGNSIKDCVNTEDIYLPVSNNVPIYTIYRSKGLEADVVFLIHSEKTNPKKMYVGSTRARDILYDIELSVK